MFLRFRAHVNLSITLALMVLGCDRTPISLESDSLNEPTAAAVGAAVAGDNTDFCYLPSHGRGAGTVPTECPAGSEYDAGLCYPTCTSGYRGIGPVCWGSCETGFTDDGALCRKDAVIVSKPSYGRGAGVAPSACPTGTVRDGALCYPQCNAGYYGVASVCWQSCSSGQVDDGAFCRVPLQSFAKSSYTRATRAIDSCPSGQQRLGALCYPVCNAGYVAEDLFCSKPCPSGFTEIGRAHV